MKLEHEFQVAAPSETVWELLLDLERVAPCLPGGEVTQKIDDRSYRANVRIKLGPMQLAYRGEITIAEADEAARRTVLEAKANEARGQGTARATITTVLTPQDDGTRAAVTTDLQLTGRVAQMGRGIVEDVSNRLMGKFAECLSQRAVAEAHPADAAASTAPPPAEAKPIGGLSLLFGALLSRLRRLFGRKA
jgi:carbon monoxide dehydrogenase subunit G